MGYQTCYSVSFQMRRYPNSAKEKLWNKFLNIFNRPCKWVYDDLDGEEMMNEILSFEFLNETQKTVLTTAFDEYGDINQGICLSYFSEEEMKRLFFRVSEHLPGVIITLYGDGENSDDLWSVHFLNGFSEEFYLRFPPPVFRYLRGSSEEMENSAK